MCQDEHGDAFSDLQAGDRQSTFNPGNSGGHRNYLSVKEPVKAM
jgi:hypothetical protein